MIIRVLQYIFSKQIPKLRIKCFFPYLCRIINENFQYHATTYYWMG